MSVSHVPSEQRYGCVTCRELGVKTLYRLEELHRIGHLLYCAKHCPAHGEGK